MVTLTNVTWELQPGGNPLILTVPANSASGRLWARTGCITSLMLPACSFSAPCPKDTDYTFCQAGPSVNGCRPLSQGPFSSGSCTSQCVSPSRPVGPGTSFVAPVFSCSTGDCNGQKTCSVSGTGPATLFEWTFTDTQDYYDISVVDGYSTSIKVSPRGFKAANQDCAAPKCSMSTSTCPVELQVDVQGSSQKACLSICSAVNNVEQRAKFPVLQVSVLSDLVLQLLKSSRCPSQNLFTAKTSSGKYMRDLVCCSCGDNSTGGCDSPSCAYGCSPYVSTYPPSYAPRTCHVEDWPLASNGQSYIQAFQNACPDSYSWQFDDNAGTHFCTVADYDVEFCA